MSLPSATAHLGVPFQRWSSTGTPGAVSSTPAAAENFAAVADGVGLAEPKVSYGERGYRHLPGYGRVETVKVTETKVGADGNTVHTVKEMAVCPECGTLNCACLARVTLQSRIEEENASGDRAQEKPQPFAVMPQSFNQLSINFATSQGSSSSRMFG